MVSIRANANHLDLFLAVCDDRDLQEVLIQQYEITLNRQGVNTYQTVLNPRDPSLRSTLDVLVKDHLSLQLDVKTVVTVLGASELFGVRLADEKSEQEKFFFSLQWTREALRQFEFPIIIWLSDTVATSISKQAPDFWNWHGGVFEFETQIMGDHLPHLSFQPGPHFPANNHKDTLQSLALIVEDIEQQIAELNHQNPKSPLLSTLYIDLGNAYKQQSRYESTLIAYEKALKQAENSNNKIRQARVLFSIGETLLNCQRYEQSQQYFKQALALFELIDEHYSQGITCHQLGIVSQKMRMYGQARTYYQNALDIKTAANDQYEQARTYYQLGRVSEEQREYEQARGYYQKSLSIFIKFNDKYKQGITYHQLGIVAQRLREYEQARTYYKNALDIKTASNDDYELAKTYHQLGRVAEELREYKKARTYYQKALDIKIKCNDTYSQASTLFQLGKIAEVLKDIVEAQKFYLQDLAITVECKDEVGMDISKRNLVRFYQRYPDEEFLASAAQILNISVKELKSMMPC
ncbi:tetratricopeptide repeat protein [Acaryochloris sp. IP29b_bin.148]|uniref:tetratricopeptide repeat protein n=1 Tax=Acaryochloris sp. IP29b_bin.148 TaxID=2969218 RepID=UPI00260DCD4E|nr:tetratricopeptide repeat protein [Acaryochloris sp. IP29b_bin.148]